MKWSSTLKKAVPAKRYLKFDMGHIRSSMYRPYVGKNLYYAPTAVDRPGRFENYFYRADSDNCVMVISDVGWRASTPSALCTRVLPDLHLCSASDSHQCFPFYVYAEDGTRSENVTDWAHKQFRGHYKDKKLTKWDIFHYVYALLHHPGYRTKFADNLKKSLPRIPFAPDFRAFAAAGRELAGLHVGYEAVEPYKLDFVIADGKPLSYRVEKMALSKDKTRLTVNDSLTLAGIPVEVSAYRLGNRSALEWVVDQYQVSEDRRSGIASDPNRADDAEYIVNLVRRVVRVSVETVRVVNALPAEFAPAATG